MALTKIPANMVSIIAPNEVTESASDPTASTNPAGGVGTVWLNTTSGEMYCCTDATTDANVWTNIGEGTGNMIANVLPGMPDDNFPAELNIGSTYNHTFIGGTDTGSSNSDIAGAVTHYVVDQISDTNALSVANSEVAAGQPHVFTVSQLSNNLTFRVRSKDNDGGYSAGRTITVNLILFNGMVATGGTITTDGDYKVHTFTSSGSFTVTTVGDIGTVEMIVVAGGGGGGNGNGYAGGGGGGAGGYRTQSAFAVTPTSYSVVVGAGGGQSSKGSTSYFTTAFQTTGGGRGGNGGYPANGTAGNGGSGGGGGWASGTQPGNEGGYNPPEGNLGGAGGPNGYVGGGGGGAGGDGQTAPGNDGGIGAASSITGTETYYAGGGGGTGFSSDLGVGGQGGGGTGGSAGQITAGSVNTGGGGGGAYYNSGSAGTGGSGIVIVRYKFQ